jgi:hypothetical protein
MDRRWSLLIPTALVIAGVGVPLILLSPIAGERPPPGHAPLAGPTGSPSPSRAEPFMPHTYRQGTEVVMPVIFPDGTRADLVYPAELDLASLNIQPNTQATVPRGDCGADLFISRDELAAGVSGSEPLAVYEGAAGPVELWRGDRAHGGYWLIFTFGSWSVAALCSDGPEEGAEDQATWAASLRGEETPEGFLVLDAGPPLELHPYRDVGGPALFLSGSDVFIELVAGSENTAHDRDPRDGVVQWRFEAGHIRLYASAFSKEGKDILEHLVEGLEFRNVTPPG